MRFGLALGVFVGVMALFGCAPGKETAGDKVGLRPDQYSNRARGENVIVAPDGTKTSVRDGADPKELGIDPYPGSVLETGALYVKETPRESTTLGTLTVKANPKQVVAHYVSQLKSQAKQAGSGAWIVVGQLADGRVVTVTVIDEGDGATKIQVQSAKPASP